METVSVNLFEKDGAMEEVDDVFVSTVASHMEEEDRPEIDVRHRVN